MLVRPTRRAHAKRAAEDDASEEHELLINEMNNAYRILGTAWRPYKLPDGTTGSPTHSGPRESDPARRARAAQLLPAPAVLITRCVRTSDTTSRS